MFRATRTKTEINASTNEICNTYRCSRLLLNEMNVFYLSVYLRYASSCFCYYRAKMNIQMCQKILR